MLCYTQIYSSGKGKKVFYERAAVALSLQTRGRRGWVGGWGNLDNPVYIATNLSKP